MDVGPFAGMGRRLLVLISGFFILFIVVAVIGSLLCSSLAKSDFFLISETEINGCRMTTKRQILDLAGIDVHSNLLALDIGELTKKLESHEWIERVVVKRDLPNRLLITIRERIPVALINLVEGLYYLDRNAVCFAAALPPEDMDFPVISANSIAFADCNGSRNDGLKNQALREALGFIRLAGRGNAALPRQNISEVHLEDNGDLVLFLMDHPVPIYLGQGEMRAKYNRLVKVLSWLYRKDRFGSIAAIKVDYMEKKVLAMLNN
jgi:cell division protein FtsQ